MATGGGGGLPPGSSPLLLLPLCLVCRKGRLAAGGAVAGRACWQSEPTTRALAAPLITCSTVLA